jgi:hypothetical protein
MSSGATNREVGRRITSVIAALALHGLLLLAALLVHLPILPITSDTVELRFLAPPDKVLDSEKSADPPLSREMTATPDPRDEVHLPPPPAKLPAVISNTNPASETLKIEASAPDSLRAMPTTALRGVLDRNLKPEQAWDILGRLLDEYPQYRESVLRELIAGSGLPPDSLPRINLHLDQMLKNGIKPTWETQRTAIEHAFRSYDPVMGWTNKGGYGPSINIIGLLTFLIDLIEGKK